jgi:alpha-tubulin suppressor-like RCC1 family protein
VYACGPGYGGRLGLGEGKKDVLYPTNVNNGNHDLEHEVVVDLGAGDMHSVVATESVKKKRDDRLERGGENKWRRIK